jgi:hypothetical protein
LDNFGHLFQKIEKFGQMCFSSVNLITFANFGEKITKCFFYHKIEKKKEEKKMRPYLLKDGLSSFQSKYG